jgi:hypothetical protein
VLFARGKEGPGWAAPYAVETGENLEGITLSVDGGGRFGRSLREDGGNGEYGGKTKNAHGSVSFVWQKIWGPGRPVYLKEEQERTALGN